MRLKVASERGNAVEPHHPRSDRWNATSRGRQPFEIAVGARDIAVRAGRDVDDDLASFRRLARTRRPTHLHLHLAASRFPDDGQTDSLRVPAWRLCDRALRSRLTRPPALRVLNWYSAGVLRRARCVIRT